MARSKRIMVKLSLPMEVALDNLAQRQGLTPATVAFMRLREGLQRTIDLPAVQDQIGRIKAQLSYTDWKHDAEMTAEQLKIEGVDANEP